MRYSKKIFISAIFVALAILVAYSAEAYGDLSEIKGKVIRLHVLANSDSLQDQELKNKVRNKIISIFNEEFEGISHKPDSSNLIVEKLSQIRDEAEKIIKEEGYDYDVDVYYGNYKFPRKAYEEIVLPEGYYDALKIEIGRAEGSNCVYAFFCRICSSQQNCNYYGAQGSSEHHHEFYLLRKILHYQAVNSQKHKYVIYSYEF
jgi:stage II sporulation protein R